MDEILTAASNGVIAILTEIASFDIMQVDTNRIALLHQTIFDAYRICSPLIFGIVKILKPVFERVVSG